MLNYMKKATGIPIVQPDDGALAAKLLVVSSTIYLLLIMGDDNIEN